MAVAKTKSKTYLKNVGKSFGYAAMDVFEHYNPTLTNIYKSSKEAVTETKRLAKEAKMKAKEIEVESDSGGGLSYILEDLASGKWYNKDRKTENEKYLSKIEKEDWGDDTTAEAVADTAVEIMRQNEQKTREMTSTISDTAQNISTSIGYTSARSAEYIVKSYAQQNRAIYNLTSTGFDRVTNMLFSINSGIEGIASLGEGLNAHMKNSSIFYINATEKLNNIDSNLEKLVKMQEAANRSPKGINRRNLKGIENIVDADGNLDMAAYVRMVKDNLDQYKPLMEAIKEESNKKNWISKRSGGTLLSNAVVSAMDVMIPKMTKEAMKQMNDALRAGLTSGLARGSRRAARSNNPIVNLLGDMFLPKDGYRDRIDTSNYEKGQVAWDGISRKALTDVIPTYLAKIYAVLGGEEKYYNYERGKFETIKETRSGHEQDKKIAAVRAGGKMREDILSDVKKNTKGAKQAQMINEVESFFLQAFLDGYDFYEIGSMVNNADFRKKYGITRESAKYIINYINSGDTKKAARSLQFGADVYRGRNEFGNTMRRREHEGTSNLRHLEDGFRGGPSGGGNPFATMQDSFGKSQAYYMRGIYMMTGNIYGLMLDGNVPTRGIKADKKQPRNASYFDPDTGLFSRQKPMMVKTGGSRAKSKGATTDNKITIEDRAKYIGMSDEQILEAKNREDIIKKYQKAFNGRDYTPSSTIGGDGTSQPKSKLASALAKAKSIYEAPFAAMTDMINSFTLAINNMFYGKDGKKGLIDKVSDYLGGLANKIFGDDGVGFGEAMKQEWSSMKTKVKTKVKSFMGNVAARDRAVQDRNVAQAVLDQVSGTSDIPGHARGKQITKTGLIAVSEGELVIPSELNPYYRGTTNKRRQIANENRIINKFYGGFAAGGTVGGASPYDSDIMEDIDPKTGKKKFYYVPVDGDIIEANNKVDLLTKIAKKKLSDAGKTIDANTGLLTNAKDGVNLLGSGIMDFIKASLFGTEKQQEEDKKKINMKMTDIFKEMGQEKGAMGIGAIAGTGVSLLTGAIVGPLAGAALGAGAGLLLKSEKIQDALFGKPDEDGNYEKPLGNFIMKKLPNIATTAGLGLAGGALMGSPVVGAIVGAAIGWAGQSDKVKDRLFGEIENGERSKGGLINKDLRDKIKKAAPNIAAGTIAGLLVGPFGLAGNIIMGSAIGYLSTGKDFHNYFFGDGKEDKGLAGIIHEKIIKGLDDLFHNTGNAMKGWLKKTGANLGSRLKGWIDTAQNKYNDGTATGIQKAIGWATAVPGKALKTATNKVGDAVQGVANWRRSKNLAEGYGVWNAQEKRNATAAERMAMRSEDDNTHGAKFDRMLAGANNADLDTIRGYLENIQDSTLEYKKVKNKAENTLYGELAQLGVDKKTIKAIIKESGSEEGVKRLRNILNKAGYDEDKKNAITQVFTKANQAIVAAKDTELTKSNDAQLLKQKYGFDATNVGNVKNLIDQLNYDQKVRFDGKEGEALEERNEEYQNDVVTMLSDLTKNTTLITEYITGRRAEGIRSEVLPDGSVKYTDADGNEVSEADAIADAKKRANLPEKIRDTTTSISETTEKVIDTISEPIKKVTTDIYEDFRDHALTPTINMVKSVASTVKDLYGIGVKGYVEGEPEINLDEDGMFGSTSRFDLGFKAQTAARRVKNLGARVKRGASDVYSHIRGKAEGGSGNSTFMDLLADKIIERSSEGKQNPDGTEEEIQTHIDMFGNVHKYNVNNQGEPEPATNDSETKKSKSIMDKFMNSVNSVPLISSAVGGLSGLLGGLKDKLVGDDKKEPGILSKLLSGLTSKDGLLGGLFSLFTGGASKLLGGITLKSVASTLLGPGLLLGGFSGLFDNVAKVLTGGAFGGRDSDIYEDSEGNKLTKNEDGTYTNDKGEVVNPQEVQTRKGDSDSLATKLAKNTGRGLLTGKSSILSKSLSKTGIGKAVKTAISAASGDAAALATVTDSILDVCANFASTLKKIPILKGLGSKLDDMGLEVAQTVSEKLASKSAKSLLSTASNFVAVAKVAFILVDFTTGYQDARSTLGIIAEPTLGQKIVSGLVRSIKNLIPVIGSFIPDNLIVKIFCKYIGPLFGIAPEKLLEQQKEAQDTVDKHNAEHGTNYTVSEYIKAELNDYTWTEKIGNSIKTAWNRSKDTTKTLTTPTKTPGMPSTSTYTSGTSVTPAYNAGYGAIASTLPSGSSSGFVSQFDPRYQGYKVSGQNFGAKGCGPAVAAMMGQSLGKNISVSDAVAGSAGYQTGNGVSIDYFQNLMNSRGINTRYIAGGASAELYNAIARGDKVALLGRDPYNTSKDRSPFGPNNHYVLATGLDRRGNVIINDPENNGPKAYSPSILNAAKYGVAGSNSGLRGNRYLRRLSGGSNYDTPVAQQVWAFFTGLGYSPETTAGIMGNMYKESTMNPSAIQGNGKGPAAGICQWENYNDKSGRWKQLNDFAISRGKQWTDLDTQLHFIQKELTSSDIDKRMSGHTSKSNFTKVGYSVYKALPYAQWKVCKDITQATYLFEIAFERAGKVDMETRLNAANAYYNLYSGKTIAYSGTSMQSLPTSMTTQPTREDIISQIHLDEETPKKTGIWNLISSVGTAFTNAFNKILGGGEEEHVEVNIPSGETSSTEFVNVNAATGPGNEKQKALANALLGIQGKLTYDMDGARNPDKGSADCSSTVNWAYKKVLGQDIGNTTDAILANQNMEIIDIAKNADRSLGTTNSQGPTIDKLMPGDLLLYSRPTSDFTAGRPYRVGHVEMYAGDGKRVGHGSGMGPKVSDATKDGSRYIMAKRLKGIAAAGSGLVSYEDLSRYAGGSSGILMKARPGSINNLPARVTNGRLVPAALVGGATSPMVQQTQAMLTNLGNRTASNGGISPELVSKLIQSITQVLERIANNTAPVNQIYQALVAYMNAGGDSGVEKATPVRINKSQNNPKPGNDEIPESIVRLSNVLAELAKG